MHFGQKIQQFAAILGRMSRTCAADLFRHLELYRGGGDYNLELGISMQLFKPGSSGALPYLEQCAAVEYLEGGGLLLREVHGYGCGVGVTAQQLENLDHYGIMSVEDTGSVSLQTSEGPLAPLWRDHENAKRQAVAERCDVLSEKKLAQQAKTAERQVLIAAVEPATRVQKCEVCRGAYRHADTFQRHHTSGACEKRQQKAAEAQSRQSKRGPAAKLVQERR